MMNLTYPTFPQTMFGPVRRRPDGTYVFATPVGSGHVPMIALADLGYFARYTFDHRSSTSRQDLEIASHLVGWDELIDTFTRVTGQPAAVVHQTLDEWFDNWTGVDNPVANERPKGDGSTTWRKNFAGWWALWRDDVVKRDMEWVRRVHPGVRTLEKWMGETGYTGKLDRRLLKNSEDGKSVMPNMERISKL